MRSINSALRRFAARRSEARSRYAEAGVLASSLSMSIASPCWTALRSHVGVDERPELRHVHLEGVVERHEAQLVGAEAEHVKGALHARVAALGRVTHQEAGGGRSSFQLRLSAPDVRVVGLPSVCQCTDPSS